MILLTFEGLERSCDELLGTVQRQLSSHVLPWPTTPVATSTQPMGADICACMARVAARLKCMQRAQSTVSEVSGVVCGAHWIQVPYGMTSKERAVLHDLMLEASQKLAEKLDVTVAKHIMIFVHVSVHEVYERLIESMESGAILLEDLEALHGFLRNVHGGAHTASIFPTETVELTLPPFAADNACELMKVANSVIRRHLQIHRTQK